MVQGHGDLECTYLNDLLVITGVTQCCNLFVAFFQCTTDVFFGNNGCIGHITHATHHQLLLPLEIN